MSPESFKQAMEGFLVPLVSLFGLLGNVLTVLVLNHSKVKLKRSLVQILCGLATFDNLFLVCTFFMFTMPCLSESYSSDILPHIAPYLLPATNTLMTCSVYATIAVAVNRFVEMSSAASFPSWLESGNVQSLLVLVFSVVFNVPRWFELEVVHKVVEVNVTMVEGDGTGYYLKSGGGLELVNHTFASLKATDLRMSESYVRWYSLLTTSIVMNVAPTAIMVYCSYRVYHRLQESSLDQRWHSNARLRARMRRNHSITRTLFGIILMFIFCHTGKIVISFYEVFYTFVCGSPVNTSFEPWAKYLIVVNTLLVVLNSSVNFAFYCGDVVFRECLATINRASMCGKRNSSDDHTSQQEQRGTSFLLHSL